MRLLVSLEAQRNCNYNNYYHHKTQGIIWNALEETPLSQLHGSSETPTFSFSNPFPRRDYEEGEKAKLLISSPHSKIIETLEQQLEDREFNIGEMPLRVTDIQLITPTVGDIGERNKLKSSVGVYIPLSKEHRQKYNISGFKESDKISWVPEHSLEAFNSRFIENLNWKLNSVHSNSIPKPDALSDVITNLNFGETYPLKLPVGSDPTNQFTFLVTQLEASYTVQSDRHRKWLQTILECGMGWRNSLGFGFTNLVEE